MKRRFIAGVSVDASLLVVFITLAAVSAVQGSLHGLGFTAIMVGFFAGEVLHQIRHYTLTAHKFKKAYDRIEDREFKRGFERGLNAKTYTERVGRPRRYDRDH